MKQRAFGRKRNSQMSGLVEQVTGITHGSAIDHDHPVIDMDAWKKGTRCEGAFDDINADLVKEANDAIGNREVLPA